MRITQTLNKFIVALVLTVASAASGAVHAGAGDFSGWPSADERDGELINIAGPFFATPYIPTIFFISVPGDATEFSVELFDGDGGELQSAEETFDIEYGAGSYTYTLYADPLKDGNGALAVASEDDDAFTNASWAPLVTARPVDAAAQAPSGNYFYRFEAVYNGDVDNDIFNNGYKLRVKANSPSTQAQVSVFQQVSVVGVPNNFTADPPLHSPDNTYDGDWNFFYFLPQAVTPEITFTDNDADYVGDAEAPGSPADDTVDPAVRVSPSVRYEIYGSAGELLNYQPDPSGDSENESFTHAPGQPVPAGAYRWHWFGVDASNTWSMFVDGELFTRRCEPDCLLPYLVGDFVWLDHNQDGVQDPDEPGIPGVCMNLIDNSGATIAQTVTDSTGWYAFNTSTGEYTVQVCPENFTAPQTRGALGNRVWLDANRNGVQDAGEPGLANVRLNLFDPGPDQEPGEGDDIFLATTVTDVNGLYRFNDLAPGSYLVDVVDSSVPLTLNLSAGPDSQPDPSPLRTITSAGETFDDLDFGYAPADKTVAIGNYVWIDANQNGLQDLNEPGVDGVTLDLLDLGEDGQLGGSGDDADVLIDATVTGNGGLYLFTDLNPNTPYAVVLTDTAQLLDGFTLTSGPQSSANPTDPIVFAGDDSSGSFLDADFGFYRDSLLTIANSVWLDSDRDGLRDSGEMGFPNVTFNLLNSNGHVIASTTSDADGRYVFSGLTAGDYRIVVTDLDGVLVDYLPTNQAPIIGQAITLADSDATGNHFGYNLKGQLELATASTTSPEQTNTVVNDNILSYDFGYYFPPLQCPEAIDFDGLQTGQVVDNEFQSFGITVTTHDPVNHPAMVFDTASPSGNDFDLGTPNQLFGGPGVGSGGASNDQPLGKVLILSEDANPGNPDDNAAGGTFIFQFAQPTDIASVQILDVEEHGGEIRAHHCFPHMVSTVAIPAAGNNSVQQVPVNAVEVCRLEVELVGSGALAGIDFNCPGDCRDCRDAGASELTLAITGGSQRDAGETIRVYEFDPGALSPGYRRIGADRDRGRLVFEGVVATQVPFGINGATSGKEMVITVHGRKHPNEYIKSRFMNNCKLENGAVPSSRYLDVMVIATTKPSVSICDSGCGRDTSGHVRDGFTKRAFDNNDGSRDWRTDWLEQDPRQPGPEQGSVRIKKGKLFLGKAPSSGIRPLLAREVDLCGSTSAELRFKFVTSSRVDPDDSIIVEASPGGGHYFLMGVITGRQTWATQSLDLSPLASEATRIRFRVKDGYSGYGEWFKLDWVEVSSN